MPNPYGHNPDGTFRSAPPAGPATQGWDIDIDVSPMLHTLDGVNEKIFWSEEELAKHQAQVKKTIRNSIMAVRAGWGLIQGYVRAVGGTISMTQRLVVSAVLGGIQTVLPLLSGTESLGVALKRPDIFIPAALGLLQVGTSLVALVQYQAGMKEESKRMRGLNFMISNMSMMLSMVKI